MRRIRSLWMVCVVGACIIGPGPNGWSQTSEKIWMDFEDGKRPKSLIKNHVTAKVVKRGDGKALRVHFKVASYPNVFFRSKEGPWDWGEYAGIQVDIHNPSSLDVQVYMRVDNERGDGFKNSNTSSTVAVPGEISTLTLFFRTLQRDKLWGMRGIPGSGPMGLGTTIDPSRVTAFQVFLNHPNQEHILFLDNIRFFGASGEAPLPFVDRFGQYKHSDWPGKLRSEEQLIQWGAEEEKELETWTEWKGRDEYGGWIQEPALEATGWFRTEQVNGTWWLVTPKGNLFFSIGMDCVGTWERTFVEGRRDWFEWLPDKDGPFGSLYGYNRGAHSMADPIGGEGETFSFYCANLIGKYGEEWPVRWRENAYRRLRGWGFNTLGNWSQGDVLEHSPMPYVVSCAVSGDSCWVEGTQGYWGKMKDVFDPRFPEAVLSSLSHVAHFHAKNPLCLGYFVDNELSWESVKRGVLASPADQPARKVQVQTLREKYGDLNALNKAWGTEVKDWDSLRVPNEVNASCDEDLNAYVYRFALQYFKTVAQALKVHAPYQLYLGCRFAGAPQNVVRACAEVSDVVSFNFYRMTIDCEKYTGKGDLGKPILIGEFHFGALDRGMFHTGLVAANDQRARAEAYRGYVRSVADCPSFVGCHWFQYVDEPITGRWFDGENYNIGFVTVADSSYPELVQAARDVHKEIYQRRLKR